jgi:hypothetical protein
MFKKNSYSCHTSSGAIVSVRQGRRSSVYRHQLKEDTISTPLVGLNFPPVRFEQGIDLRHGATVDDFFPWGERKKEKEETFLRREGTPGRPLHVRFASKRPASHTNTNTSTGEKVASLALLAPLLAPLFLL